MIFTSQLLKAGCLLLATLNLQTKLTETICGTFAAVPLVSSFTDRLFHLSSGRVDGLFSKIFKRSTNTPLVNFSLAETLGYSPIETWGSTLHHPSPPGACPIQDAFIQFDLPPSCPRPQTSLAVTGFTSPVPLVCIRPRQPSRPPHFSLSAFQSLFHVTARVLPKISTSTIQALTSVVSSKELALNVAYVITDSVFTQVLVLCLPLFVALSAILLGLQEWMAESAPLALVRIHTLRYWSFLIFHSTVLRL